jgi:hypothetical protein
MEELDSVLNGICVSVTAAVTLTLVPCSRWFQREGEAIELGLRRTVEGRDTVMRSLIRAVYRFRDATFVAEKKNDFGNALQNLYRELERAEDLAAACDRLFTDHGLGRRMGYIGFVRVKKHYHRELWLERIRHVYATCGVKL